MVYKSLLIGLIAFAVSGCSTISETFQQPELTQVEFQSAPAGTGEYTGTIRLKLKNPNSYAIQAKEVQYKLVINDDDVTTGSFDRGVDIPPGQEAEVVGKIKFKYTSDQAQTSAASLLVEPFVLSGTASVGLHMIHFNHSGKFTSAK